MSEEAVQVSFLLCPQSHQSWRKSPNQLVPRHLLQNKGETQERWPHLPPSPGCINPSASRGHLFPAPPWLPIKDTPETRLCRQNKPLSTIQIFIMNGAQRNASECIFSKDNIALGRSCRSLQAASCGTSQATEDVSGKQSSCHEGL